jgi:large subunit ribosomal protein LP1
MQADNITTLVKAAGVEVEPYWPTLFANLAAKKSIEEFILNVGSGGGGGGAAAPAAGGAAAAAAPAAEAAKEEEEEEDAVSRCSMICQLPLPAPACVRVFFQTHR